MQRYVAILLMLLSFSFSCAKKTNTSVPATPQTPDMIARDAIAASSGAIKTLQAKYQSSCSLVPNQPTCTTINQAIYAQQTAIAALYTYCQFTQASTPDQACKRVDSALPALTSATANLNQIVTSLKGALQ